MPIVEVFDKNKVKIEEIELKDAIFSVPTENRKTLVSEVIRMQTASWRQGTHSTRTYATISGGCSKPWRQKGTGRARRGTTRASTLRGGAPAFGPQPRDYSYTVPKKKRKAAMRALLSDRLGSGHLFVIKEFNFENIKTKDAVSILKGKWSLDEAIIVGGDSEEKFLLSVRNIPEFLFIHKTQINLYDIMAYKNVIFTEEAVKYVDEVLGK
ncbi:MAG TPA: 50S ribosomal protein L4 [bacterium]|mgnify:CR=1 FL=1|nr:50S ribosomal protein L4 [bacterium]